MSEKYIDSIVRHYENCLEKYGDTHLGVDWPKLEDVNKRYSVMLDVIKFSGKEDSPVSLLDFGSGAGHLLNYIEEKKIKSIDYSGLDVSEKFISLSREKFPGIPFYRIDILENGLELPDFDYVVMNGVFTEKRELSFQEMWDYFCRMLLQVFEKTRVGVAFNVMSKAVEWEREDLFHLPTDLLIEFVTKRLSRDFIIRNDYGLYEYTTYLYK